MPAITENVCYRVLTEPKGYRPFLGFAVGKDRQEELEVMLTIHNMWAGTTQVQQIAVLLEKDVSRLEHTGQRPLIGVATIATIDLDVEGVQGLNPDARGAIVGVIGTDLAYRKHTLRDGRRPGNALLRNALEVIETMFGGKQMPFVRANVKPTNSGSKPLFDEHGFENLGVGGGADGSQLALFRPPGTKPNFKRQPTWSSA